MKKPFNRFAVEPTFYFDVKKIVLPYFLKDSYDFDADSMLKSASEYMEVELKKKSVVNKHPWLKKAYEDGDTLEIPSTIYTDKKKFIKDYDRLAKFLEEKYQFLPSSVVDMEVEGGCHMNVTIPKEIYNSKMAEQFFDNLQSYLTNHPSIVWAFLAPTDNNSSVVPFKSDPRHNSKGDFFTIRDEDGDDLDKPWNGLSDWQGRPLYYGENVTIDRRNGRIYSHYNVARRIELRFFVQPRTTFDMKLEIDFGLHLLNWIWQSTVRGEVWKQKNTKASLRAYTLEKTLLELKDACDQMEFDYDRLLARGRNANLREKFNYSSQYFV